MVTIRFFKTRRTAEAAAKILKTGGFFAEVSEDKFNNTPIQTFGVPARFRLKINNYDLNRAAKFLARKISK